MAAAPLKVLLLGPSKTGKSSAASFLAGQGGDSPLGGFSPGPTVGVRILTFERAGAQVELWDVSGDQSYEPAWPAVQKGAEAALVLFNADAPGSAKEAELWLGWFKPPVCAVAGFTAAPGAASTQGKPNPAGLALPSQPAPGSPEAGAFAAPPELIAVDGGGDALRRVFDRLLARAAKRRA